MHTVMREEKEGYKCSSQFMHASKLGPGKV